MESVGPLPPWLVGVERGWACCLKWPELGEQMQSSLRCTRDSDLEASLHVGAI